MKPYIVCEGSVRGNCWHKHRTIRGALKCLKDDQIGCERQGGYSDRELVAYSEEHGCWSFPAGFVTPQMLDWPLAHIISQIRHELSD